MSAASIRVLLLEDDPADARLVATMLRRLPGPSFEVEVVNRLGVASERLARGGLDVVLADLSLPDSVGLSTLKGLASIAPDIPLVVLTGNDDDSLAIEALKQGAQDYLVKGRGDASVLGRVIRHAIERKATERALKEARDRAEAAVRAKSVFLAMVGHEIRTPLNGILGMARLLLDTPLDQRQRTFAETVVSSGELLLGLVNDILDFSRLEAEGLTLESVDFDLLDTVEELRLMLAPRAADKGLTLGCRFAPDVPRMVRGDPLRLRQILLNLVGNAIKFTEKGTVLVAVEVAAIPGPEGGRLFRIAVSDTGIGISEQARADLFTEFAQADSSITRRFGGTGLGLAICKRLVRLMGGRIGYDSRPGEGSTFWFEIPFGEAPDSAASEDGAPPVPTVSARLLLVDDNPVNLQVASGLLQRHGHVVTAVEGGAAALALAAAGEGFDLVLLDMHMPGMDGIETARRLRGRGGALARVPVYLLTANPLEQHERVWREAGIDGCLGKPFRVEEVLRLLAGGARGDGVSRQGGPDGSLVALPELLADMKDLGQDRMAGLVDLFATTSSEDLGQAERLARAGEAEALAATVHRMASAAASLHLVALADTCRAIENAARQGDLAAAGRAEGLRPLWERSLRSLRDVVAS